MVSSYEVVVLTGERVDATYSAPAWRAALEIYGDRLSESMNQGWEISDTQGASSDVAVTAGVVLANPLHPAGSREIRIRQTFGRQQAS